MGNSVEKFWVADIEGVKENLYLYGYEDAVRDFLDQTYVKHGYKMTLKEVPYVHINNRL